MMIFLTGSSGFIGLHTKAAIVAAGHRVRVCVRRPTEFVPRDVDQIVVPDIGYESEWPAKIAGARCVLHVAGSAHLDAGGDSQKEAEVRRTNVTGTGMLARAAMDAGVSRFVFVSSIGVNGSQTRLSPFTEEDLPAPSDFYSSTKFEAEQTLHRICEGSSMQLVVIRPTLVAGPGAPGNLERLVKIIRSGFPVPIIGSGSNRSLIGVRSLADLLVLACVHPAATGRTFLAADNPPLPLSDIAVEIGKGMQKRVRLLRLPRAPMEGLALLSGRRRDFDRLGQSLVVDSSAARETLGWRTTYPIHDELRETGAAARLASESLK
jgi:nucleoside-diphosphate-sugar epimerase